MVVDIPFTFHDFCISIAQVAICTRYNKRLKCVSAMSKRIHWGHAVRGRGQVRYRMK